jgi:hypothetical protein
MSKMRKSLAVLSSAIAPILLVSAPAMAGLSEVVSVTTANLPTATAWPSSPTYSITPLIDSSNLVEGGALGTPSNTGGGTGLGDVPGAALGESFTTGANGFSLGAISLYWSSSADTTVGGAGGDTVSLHLYQLIPSYKVQSAGLTLGPAGSGSEATGDLLGGGNGLAYTAPAAGQGAEILEFDFSGTDQVALQPNTPYYFEVWNTSTDAGAGNVTIERQGGTEAYTGGEEYQTTSTGPTVQTPYSTVTRSIASSGAPRTDMFAVYPATASGAPFWNQAISGNWSNAFSWSNLAVPNAVGAEADFLSSTSTFDSPRTVGANNGVASAGNVYTDTAKTVGTMNFDNTAGYVLDGAGSLTLQVASGNAAINVLSGTQEINLPLTIASPTIINVAGGTTLKIADPLIINAGESLTRTGSGTVNYLSTITVGSGGAINFSAPTQVTSLALSASATAVVADHTGSNPVNLIQVNTLTTDTGSQLDLGNNDMILHSGPLISVGVQLSSVAAALKNGFNAGSGYWNGTNGIASSAAASDPTHLTTLGYMQSQGGSFDGVSTTTSDVLVKYTYYGDANLDGSVDGADYQQIDAGFGLHLTGWQNGDFNYDGVVDGSDYSLIDNTFNQLTASGASSQSLLASPSDVVSPANVPEPATLSLLGIGALSLLGRRRRNG